MRRMGLYTFRAMRRRSGGRRGGLIRELRAALNAEHDALDHHAIRLDQNRLVARVGGTAEYCLILVS